MIPRPAPDVVKDTAGICARGLRSILEAGFASSWYEYELADTDGSALLLGRHTAQLELMTHARTVAVVRANLIEVFADVDGWFGRPVDERAFRPVSQGWTIDQVLEHVSLTNHFLMLTLRKAVEKAVRLAALGRPIPAGDSDLQRLEAIGQRGSFPWLRPEHMDPSGRTTPDEVRAILQQQREECLALLERLNHGEGALCQLRMSVNALGRIDLYQWLYFLAQHARRHLQQMASIEEEFKSVSPV